MKILFIGLPSILALAHLFMSLRSYLYVRFFPRKFYLRTDYSPKVSIFVPCKGIDAELDENLTAIADQDYSDLTVSYIVESEADPAGKVIKGVVDRYPNTTFVIAGLAHNCGQKNHNLLQAIARDSGGSEVYVFCDSDVKPDRGWLRNLINPLAEERTPVATGFRWIIPLKGSFGEILHAMMNAYLSMLMAARGFKGVWGGSMAIRREVFEKLGVAEWWKHTVVDDISLSQLLVVNRVTRVYVPFCLTESYEAIPSVKGAMVWFIRQIKYARYYLKSFWALAIILISLTSLVIISTPFLLVAGVFYGEFLWGGIAGLVFTVFAMFDFLLIKSIGRKGRKSYLWFFLSPLFVLISTYCLWKTAFSRSLLWRDTLYNLDKNGRVLSVVRKGTSA